MAAIHNILLATCLNSDGQGFLVMGDRDRRLAEEIKRHVGAADVIILGIPTTPPESSDATHQVQEIIGQPTGEIVQLHRLRYNTRDDYGRPTGDNSVAHHYSYHPYIQNILCTGRQSYLALPNLEATLRTWMGHFRCPSNEIMMTIEIFRDTAPNTSQIALAKAAVYRYAEVVGRAGLRVKALNGVKLDLDFIPDTIYDVYDFRRQMDSVREFFSRADPYLARGMQISLTFGLPGLAQRLPSELDTTNSEARAAASLDRMIWRQPHLFMTVGP